MAIKPNTEEPEPELTPDFESDAFDEDEFDLEFWSHQIPELPRVSLKQKSLCWNPGRLITVKRERFTVGCALMCAVPGALVFTFLWLNGAQLLLGGAGSWPVFLTTIATGLIVGGLLVFRLMRGPQSEITFDWHEQILRCREGRKVREYAFDEIQQITISSVQRPNYFRAQLEVRLDHGSETLLETDPAEDEALVPCHQLAPAAKRLAESLSVPLVVEIDGQIIDNAVALDGAPSAAQVAANYEKLGDRRWMEMEVANMKGRGEESDAKKQAATSYYMEAARLNPSRTTPLLEVAKLSDNDEHLERAIEIAIETNPDDPEPLMARGWRLAFADKYDEALADFTEAIRLKPSVKSYHGRADVNVMRENYAAAVDDFTAALELEPDNPRCHHERGSCLREWYGETKQEDLLNRALADLEAAARLEPDDDSHQTERCAFLKDAGRFVEAISGFSELIAADGSNFYLFSQRGQAYFDAGEFRKAVRDFSSSIEALEKEPRPADSNMQKLQDESIGYAFRWRSDAYRQMGENTQADDDAARSEELLD